jgi:acetyltransferase
MGTYGLDRLLAPRSVALVGGSLRDNSLGRIVLKNLRDGGFEGPIDLVNSNYAEIDGVPAHKSISDLPGTPDVVVVVVPPPSVPDVVAAAGVKGCGAAIILTAGLGHGAGSLAERTEQEARRHGLRIVGPNCLGVLVPPSKLNASFAARMPLPGDLALISQSGAIAAGLIEWAATRSIGFSAMVSIGDQIDVDIADLLDHFALDRRTRAILLYVESINNARKFMSAARAAARTKPVVVIKAGRHAQGAIAAQTHTGALAGSDEVYDAAFRRAGLLRVRDFDELFAAAETLGRLGPFSGKRLAILTNGGGIGVLAVDRLMDLGGVLATVGSATKQSLDAALPPTWSRSNPVDIAGDANERRYVAALKALLADDENDAILVINVPTGLASSVEVAKAIGSAVRKDRSRIYPTKPVLAVWIGDDGRASRILAADSIPHYPSEADAIQGFMHLVRYREALDALMETPPSLPQDFAPEVRIARSIVAAALSDGRGWLDPVEVARLLAAYAIPIASTVAARTAEEAMQAARPLLAAGGAVAVKIYSPDIIHKSEYGGVRLNLTSAEAVCEATAEMLNRVKRAKPEARIIGVTLHPMIVRPKARELIAGIADDPTFGPVIAFGRGGTAVEVINDKALALPPLDLKLAHELITRTRVSRVLKAYRHVPAADHEALALVLVKLAQLAADVPEIREVDLNPLLADETGIVALDARVAVAQIKKPRRVAGHPRFAIRPYPSEWERRIKSSDGTAILIRPVRPDDERLYGHFFSTVSQEDLRLRFFAPVKRFDHTFIARMTQLDYARAIAFVAIAEPGGEMLGVAQLHANANYDFAEYAVLVRSDLKGKGLGWALMQTIIDYGRSEGLRAIEGQVLNENRTMLEMCRELGFQIAPDPHDTKTSRVCLTLDAKT